MKLKTPNIFQLISIAVIFMTVPLFLYNYKKKSSEKKECFDKFLVFEEKYLSREFRIKHGLPIINFNKKIQNRFEIQLVKKNNNNKPSVFSYNYYCFNNSEEISYKLSKDSIIILNTFFDEDKIRNNFTLEIDNNIKTIMNKDMQKAYFILKKHNLIDNSSNYFYGLNKDSLVNSIVY